MVYGSKRLVDREKDIAHARRENPLARLIKKLCLGACQMSQIIGTMRFATLRAFLSSSVVERSTVNRLVASSNLAWGVLENT